MLTLHQPIKTELDGYRQLENLERDTRRIAREQMKNHVNLVRTRWRQGQVCAEVRALAAEKGVTLTFREIGAKSDVHYSTLQQCEAFYQKVSSIDALNRLFTEWTETERNITWGMVRNWVRKRLPTEEEDAQKKLAKLQRDLERKAERIQHDAEDLLNEARDWEPEMIDEAIGTALHAVEVAAQALQSVSMVTLQKPERERSNTYLSYIRSRACCVCGEHPAEPHHIDRGGVGTKGSDYHTIPVCRSCHDEIHTVGQKTYWQDYSPWEIAATCLSTYITLFE